MRFRLAALLLAAPLLSLVPQDQLAPFQNRGASFLIDLPKDWRQIAPNQALQLRERPDAPAVLTRAEPRAFYAVGPIDMWLAGDFAGAWLYVVEQQDEWYVDDDFAATLAASWRQHGETHGERHELRDIRRQKIGSQEVDAVVAIRRTTPPLPRPEITSLDVHTPAGGQQITLSFQCPTAAFVRLEPEFRRWLATLKFARPPRPAASLGDRLWTPLITGAVVFLVLFGLWKHTRGARR
jgi:hypothetical protein